MAFDWGQYHELAKSLGASGTEAARRSAISRTYYAAFHAAISKERAALGPSPEHAAVWQYYMGSNDLERRKVGTAGDRVRRMRRRADYDDTIANLESTTTDALQTVAVVLSKLLTI
jgi:uncharacterized protein (UPF0332 family)